MHVQVEGGLRNMSIADTQEYKARVERLLDDSPILCDWDTLDLRSLATVTVDSKEEKAGQLVITLP